MVTTKESWKKLFGLRKASRRRAIEKSAMRGGFCIRAELRECKRRMAKTAHEELSCFELLTKYY
jgi:hypothetical protein